jgi:hypothetical protein
MKNIISAKSFVLAFSLLGASSVALAGVENEAELRMALANGETDIEIDADIMIMMGNDPFIYSGSKALSINGNGNTISRGDDGNILELTQGADLSVENLDFEGPGGYTIQAQGEGIGILVNVPETRTGIVKLNLKDVEVSGTAEFGVLVQDCNTDPCGSGSGGAGNGSKASVSVDFDNVLISDCGNGAFDGDGARVNERDQGNILFSSKDTTFINNGADGLELDEGQGGSIISNIKNTHFTDNGAYCDPSLITLPDPDEAEDLPTAGDGAITEDELLAFKNNALDPMCVEIEYELHTGLDTVKEYESGIDLDDGVDFDEAGKGGITSNMSHSTITGNLDEGVDFDEENQGGTNTNFMYVDASNNEDDGIKVSEEDAGSVVGNNMMVTADSNGGKAIVYEEADNGNLSVNVLNSMTDGNNDGGDEGIEVVQEDKGTGKILVRDSTIVQDTPVVAEGVTEL